RVAGGSDVSGLDLEPGAYEPELPVVRGAIDRLGDLPVGRLQVASELLHQCQLQPRAGGAGLARGTALADRRPGARAWSRRGRPAPRPRGSRRSPPDGYRRA